ncbi:MAG: hypothetical protein N3B12_09400, partial [Armatimonadetes bacterium]|nr:hypothetical protein [Armatimonadota bacterium]
MFLFVITILAAIAVSALSAQTWEWPSEITLGGFSITSIRGSVNEDGSGTASGLVQIPGIAVQRVTLNRSTAGEIAGNVSMSARISGAEIQGGFT